MLWISSWLLDRKNVENAEKCLFCVIYLDAQRGTFVWYLKLVSFAELFSLPGGVFSAHSPVFFWLGYYKGGCSFSLQHTLIHTWPLRLVLFRWGCKMSVNIF